MKEIKVSIIIPVFYGGELFRRCLESILNQRIRNIECIFIFEEYKNIKLAEELLSGRDDLFVIGVKVQKTDSGTCRNIGLRKARGKYVLFVDEDDELCVPDAVERLYVASEYNKINICGGSLIYIDINGNKMVSVFRPQKFENNGFVEYKNYQEYGGFQRFIYKSDYLRTNNIEFPSLSRFQDSVFIVRCLLKAGKFYCIKDDVYKYRKYKKTILTCNELVDHISGCVEILDLSKQWGYVCLNERMLATIRYLLLKNGRQMYLSEKYGFNFIIKIIPKICTHNIFKNLFMLMGIVSYNKLRRYICHAQINE